MSKPVIVIDGFEGLSAQAIFDMAVSHIAQTRKPSVVANSGACVYSGSGCNAAPFIKPEWYAAADGVEAFPDRDIPKAMGWQSLMRAGYVPDHAWVLMNMLQEAHDTAARDYADHVDSTQFGVAYVVRMRDVASVNGLNTDAFAKLPPEWLTAEA